MIGVTVSHYRITGTLGCGGMGVVFEARDERLGRQVAVKLLPEAVRDPHAFQRLRHEAQAAASLNHPNICTLHDIGEHDGRPFLVMERMHGRTLKEHIGGRPRPVDEIVRVADQIADALDAAHRAGVVHRDLKPGNVFLTDRGDAKLLDFGLVKLTEDATSPSRDDDDATASAPVTRPGSAPGTAPYMSPEQAGGAAVDHRTDLYSLGVLLYEMATGTAPHGGGTKVEILYSVLQHEPAPPSERNPDLPAFVEDLIVRLLAKKPQDRYQTAAEVRADLAPYVRASTSGVPAELVSAARMRRRRRVRKLGIPVALAVAVTAAAVGWQLVGSRSPVEDDAAASRIAVLPFDILGPAEDAYFAVGISDEVRSRLTSMDGLVVIAGASARQYAGSGKAPETIAEELGVRYLLSGTVQRQRDDGGDRVRVTPELVEMARGAAPTIRWQDTFDVPLEDVFGVQTRVANRVTRALDLALAPEPAAELSEPPTSDLEAYDAYLRGQEIWGRQGAIDPISLREAALLFERAVALDPEFAEARVELARISAYLFSVVEPSPSMRDTASANALRAVELAPEEAGAHLAMGDYNALVAREFRVALQHYSAGLEINPSHAELLSASGYSKISLGLWEEALVDLREAHDLDPRSAQPANRLAFALLCLRRYAEAEEVYLRGLTAAPTDLNLLQGHAMVHLARGDLDGARAVLDEPEVDRTALVAHVGTYWGLYWLLDGDQRALLLRLPPTAFGGNRAYWGLILASTARLCGDTDLALDYAHQADAAFGSMLAAAPDDPQLNVLHGLNQGLLGRTEAALAAADRAGRLLSVNDSALYGAFIQHVRARIHFLVGDVDGGFDLLEPLLEVPYYLSPGWLRVDPDFDGLRDHPRYRRLAP